MNRYSEIENRGNSCGAPLMKEPFGVNSKELQKIVETWVIYGISFIIYRLISYYAIGHNQGEELFDLLFLQAAVFVLIGFSLYHLFVEPLLPKDNAFMNKLLRDVLFFGLGVLAVNTLLPLANNKTPSISIHPFLVVLVAMLGYHMFNDLFGLFKDGVVFNPIEVATKIGFIILAQVIV